MHQHVPEATNELMARLKDDDACTGAPKNVPAEENKSPPTPLGYYEALATRARPSYWLTIVLGSHTAGRPFRVYLVDDSQQMSFRAHTVDTAE